MDAEPEHATFSGAAETTVRPLRDELGRILPGQPAMNPHGRPRKGQSMTEALARYLAMTPRELRALRINDLPAKDAHAVRQILDGLKTGGAAAASVAGKARAYTYNRIDGLPRQTVDLNTDAQERTDQLFDRMQAFLETDDDTDDDGSDDADAPPTP